MAVQYIGTGRPGTTQSVAYTGTAGVVTNGFGTGVYKVRVFCTTAAFVSFGAAPTATTSDMPVAANTAEYFTVTAGQKASAIQSAAGGTLYVTEMV